MRPARLTAGMCPTGKDKIPAVCILCQGDTEENSAVLRTFGCSTRCLSKTDISLFGQMNSSKTYQGELPELPGWFRNLAGRTVYAVTEEVKWLKHAFFVSSFGSVTRRPGKMQCGAQIKGVFASALFKTPDV